MFTWLYRVLKEVQYFLSTWEIRDYWRNLGNQGYLIERQSEGKIRYTILDPKGHRLRVEIEGEHNYIVRQMKRSGVTIIPSEAMITVWGGNREFEDVIKEYSQKPQQK